MAVRSRSGAPAAELKVLSWHCERSNSGSYMILEGEVRNLTDAPISRLMAVARYHTKNDQFVRSDDALIAYNPIMPGQTSPFKIMSTYNPMTARCSLSFKRMSGGTVAAEYHSSGGDEQMFGAK